MAPKVEKIENTSYILGEGPHWDDKKQILYFVDVLGKKLVSYNPKTNQINEASTAPKQASFIIPIEGRNDEFVISLDNQLVQILWPQNSSTFREIETLAEPDPIPFKFNDAKCDSKGRLWAGTYFITNTTDLAKVEPLGSLHLIQGKEAKKVLGGIKLANGLAFDDKRNKFYYIDSLIGTVDQFDYNPEDGSISNREVLFTLSKHKLPGIADGMAIDSDGNLWVANSDGGRIIQVATDKKETILQTVKLAASQSTSVVFGGPNLDELYVTTGAFNIPRNAINGPLYKITNLGVKGLPSPNFVLT